MNISPLDESGQKVDYWFIYKVPKLTNTSGVKAGMTAVGYEYLYYDSKTQKAVKSPNVMTQDQGALHNTLDSVFKNPGSTTGWILYNDEKPADAGNGKDNGELGHTTGVLAFDTQTNTGLWLLHSWPKYADPDSETMPTPMFGQTFLCLSIDLNTVRQIAGQMINYQQPQTYLPHIPGTLPATDVLNHLIQPLDENVSGGTSILDLKTKGGLAFKVIAKNREWGRDFWNDLVGPTLKADIDVESWIRGPIAPNLGRGGISKNIENKFIGFRAILGWAWPETKDHAKWAITKNTDGNSSWVCVGDMNRMISQEKRGGCTIAFQDDGLWGILEAADLIVPPPGLNIASSKALIQKS